MKKILFSMLTSLMILLMFGIAVFVVFAGPSGITQPTTASQLPEADDGLQLNETSLNSFNPDEVSYEISQPEYAWIDVSSESDEQIAPSDFEDNVGSAAIDIGFYFPFFDQIYNQVHVSDNGYIYFDGDEASGGNVPQNIPSSIDPIHNLIAPIGADLFRNADDSVVYIARQTEPEQRLIIQFAQVYWCCNLEDVVDFQIVLYPDGRILTQYKTIGGDSTAKRYLTAGIENSDGSRGHNLYSGFLAETDMLVDEAAMLYDPGDSILGQIQFMPETIIVEGNGGETLTLTADLLNLSGVDVTFALTHTLQINEASATSATDSDGWTFATVAEPTSLGNGESGPLAIEITIPADAAPSDIAVLSFEAMSDAVESSPQTIMTIQAVE